jgi:RNA polymerase sigma factor (TIGR02999 family)
MPYVRSSSEHAGRIPPPDDPGREGDPIDPARAEVTRVLHALAQGEGKAARDLLPLVYDELRKLAAHRLAGESPGQTLQATALVHEAYLRLIGPGPGQSWEHRGHFFAAAAEAMRRILVDRARDRRRQKRGGGRKRVRIDLDALFDEPPDNNLLALDEALEKLAVDDPAGAQLVRLRAFAGLTLSEAAEVMGLSKRTAERYWTFARAWLCEALDG